LLGQFPRIRAEPFFAPHKGWWKDIVGYDAPLMRYSGLLGTNMLVILDTDLIREILMAPAGKDDCRFFKPTIFFLPALIPQGLVTLEGKEWLKHRRLVQPSFSVSYLKEALDECVPPKVERFVKLWLQAGEKQEIDVISHLAALTLDVIGDVGFSCDCNGLKDLEQWVVEAQQKSGTDEIASPKLSDPLISSLEEFTRPDLGRVILALCGLNDLDQYVNPKTIRLVKALNSRVDGIIAAARSLDFDNKNNDTSKQTTKSLIQVLMNTKDSDPSSSGDGIGRNSNNNAPLSDSELRDELKTFLLAGHETTSTWCHWALFALSKFPDVQEKLYQNVLKEAPSLDSVNSRITLEHVEQMDYLHCFLQECLRLYPPVGLTLRLNRYEEKFAGYKIPPQTNLVIPMHLIHRHPKHWSDPETFRPERWSSPSDSAPSGLDTKGFTFLPFGAGGKPLKTRCFCFSGFLQDSHS